MTKKILLVEDEAIIAMTTSKMLQKHDFEVVIAHKGEKAIAAVDKDPDISLVLMDINLGNGMDGTEAAEKILEVHDLPIVFLTSHSEKEYVDRVKRITRYGYVLKNSGEFVLKEAIEMALLLFDGKKREEKKEKQLHEQNAYLDFYRLAVDAMDDHKVSVVDSNYRYKIVNRRYSRDAGLQKEEIVGKTVAEMLGNDAFKAIKPDIDRCFAGESVKYSRWFEYPEAGRRYMEVSYYPLLNNDGEIDSIAGIIKDITERKRYEEELNHEQVFLSSVLDTIKEAIIICDKNGKITRFNKAARRLHELPEKPIPSDRWSDYYDLYTADGTTPLPTEDIPLFRAFNGEDVHNAELVVKPKSKPARLLSCSGHQMLNNRGEKIGAVIAMHDITDYRQTEEHLRGALKEKNYLMRELNHRVKNNLNMVSALISLKDSETDYDLSDLKHRIDTIKLVHEKLNQHDEVDRIELKEYFQEILKSVFSFSAKLDVYIENRIKEVSVRTKTAIPLGLVVNEIATNAIKYGFTSDETARFTVTLSKEQEAGQYALTLSNTGKPFPEDIGLENPETMGLQLVSTLVKQLNGTIELQKRPNPVFTIRFPVEE